MSTYWQARTLLQRGQVRFDGLSSFFLYFWVKDYNVTYNLRKKAWSCTCLYDSFYRGEKSVVCKHVRACQFFVKEFGNNVVTKNSIWR